MTKSQDKEIQQYRDLMEVPDQFVSGFGIKTVVAALMLGFLMVPGSIYLTLVVGGGTMASAARWVTVILFAEVARRSMSTLRQQEIFVLFYMTGVALGGQLQGGVMTQLIWNQYLVRSDLVAAMGVDIPSWVAPSREIIEAHGRTFFTREWAVPIVFLAGMFILQRIDGFGLGYALYRLTSQVEKLPFPMAPVGALAVTALAEERDKSQRWRWRCFSIGGVLGLIFGFLYIGMPAITGITLIPLPWLDLTSSVSTEKGLAAVPFNIAFDAGMILTGMVLPFWAVVGGFLAFVIQLVLNPILYRNGVLTSWQPGMNMVSTLFSNYVDFYLSFGIGLALAIFLYSLYTIGRSLLTLSRQRRAEGLATSGEGTGTILWRELNGTNKERGDMSFVAGIAIYLFSTFTYIAISRLLIPDFPWLFFLGFALIYQPMISYVNAKLEGMVGQAVSIPMVREVAYILSGYKGSAIWFAPIPLTDYGSQARTFREMELTGTRLSSLIKTEFLVIPVVIVCSLLFSQFIWQLGEIPGESFKYAQEFWDYVAMQTALQITATSEGSSMFLEALKFDLIGWGAGIGLVMFLILNFLGLPTFLVFGAVRSLGGNITPGSLYLELAGALIGRFYLEKKFGHKFFKQYVMILGAGFGAGMGLVGMAAVAIALIAKNASSIGY